MKRGILCFMLAAFVALPALAAAEANGVYIAPKFLVGIQDSGQISRTNVSSEAIGQYNQAVFGGALAVGYNFAPKFQAPIRTEIEYAMRSVSSHRRDGGGWGDRWETRQTTNLYTLFLNAYLDINTGTPLTPYVGGGLGMAFNNTSLREEWNGVETDSRQRWDTTLAWNAGGGLAYAFTENVTADLGYRFIGTGYREFSGRYDDGTKWNVGSAPYIHEFYLGARFTF